jgi:hypothetical protein
MSVYPSQAFLFLMGALVFHRFNLVGVLTLSEILTLGYFCLDWRRVLQSVYENRILRGVMLAWMAYLAMQMTSDMVNATLVSDMQRGWARLVFFGVNIAVLGHVSRFRIDRLMAFYLGYVLSLLYNTYTVSDEWLLEWKFGYGPLLTMSITLFMGLAGPGIWGQAGALSLVAAGLIHMQSNARSLGGLSVFVGMLSLLADYFSRNLRDRSSALRASFLMPVFLFIFSIYQVYSYGASSGLFGEKTMEKYNKQTADGRNIVSGARMEYTIAIPAIMEAPVLGYGSWARNTEWVKKYIYINKMDPTAYDAEFLMELGIIPTHSHILGSWAEAGFMGGFFWFFILYLTAATFISMLRHVDMPFRAFLLFITALFMWDILFSPFGLERRILDPAVIILVVTLRQWMDETEESKPNTRDGGLEETDASDPAWSPTHA